MSPERVKDKDGERLYFATHPIPASEVWKYVTWYGRLWSWLYMLWFRPKISPEAIEETPNPQGE